MSLTRKTAVFAAAASVSFCAMRAEADALIPNSGGVIRVQPYPVSAPFLNTAWSAAQEDAFWTRNTAIISYVAGGGTQNSTYFENEKASFPRTMLAYINAVANNNTSVMNTAKGILNQNHTADAGNVGGAQNTEYVDLFPSFTLKAQMPKYYWFGKLSKDLASYGLTGVSPNYLDKTYATNATGIDAPWAGRTYLERFQEGARKWTDDNYVQPNWVNPPNPSNTNTNGMAFPDPLYRPNYYNESVWQPGDPENWTVAKRNSWVDIRNTDNLKTMREGAVYLMATETGNTNNASLYAGRLRQHAVTLFRTGMSEWDSENYAAWSVAPWMNVYDYAPETVDGQTNPTKLHAKAALDFQMAAYALKYFSGTFTGPSKRSNNNSNVPLKGSISTVLYQYFGDTPLSYSAQAVAYNDAHLALNPILSAYRPPQAVVGLALRDWGSFHSGPVEMINTKPSYANWADPGSPTELTAPRSWETMFFGANYRMGSLVSNSGESDVDPFAVVIRNTTRGSEVFDAGSGDGSSALFTKRAGDQIAQYRNLAVWLRSTGTSVTNFTFQAPTSAVREMTADAWFFRFQSDQTWLAVRPINLGYSSNVAGTGNYAAETYHFGSNTGGAYFGFALEIGDHSQYADYSAFKSAVLSLGSLDLSQIGSGIVALTGADGGSVRLAYNTANDLPAVERNGQAYDWLDPDNYMLYKSINQKPTAAVTGISDGQTFMIGDAVGLGSNAYDSGQRGPMSLEWKKGTLSVLAGGFLFEETVAADGAVSFSERAAVSADYLGEVRRVEWYANGVLVGEDDDGSDGWNLNWTPTAVGAYSLRARAIDNDAEVGWSAPISINVVGTGPNEWKLAGGGNWSDAGSWTNATVPDAIDAPATFGTNLASASVVNVDLAATVGQLNFAGAQSYTLGGTGSITMSSTGSASITLSGSTPHTVDVPLTIASDTTVVSGGSNLALAQVNVNAGQTLAYAANGSTTARIADLNLAGTTGAWTSALDLNDNDLVIQAGTNVAAAFADVYDQVRSGFGSGLFDGTTGIISTTAALDGSGQIGPVAALADDGANLFLTQFNGIAVDSTSIVVKFTYLGDLNLDGTVDVDDYLQLVLYYNQTGQLYVNGDVNLDGTVNVDDYLGLVINFGKSGLGGGGTGVSTEAFAAGVEGFAAGAGGYAAGAVGYAAGAGGYSAVPEPGTLGVLALAGAGLLRRRRRA